jgi:hypothetical protein
MRDSSDSPDGARLDANSVIASANSWPSMRTNDGDSVSGWTHAETPESSTGEKKFWSS